MAEPLHYDPSAARDQRGGAETQRPRSESRAAEIDALLDELYEAGVIRWLKDLAGALPEVATIALQGADTPQGRAGLRNLLLVAQQLGRIDPDRLERILEAVQAGIARADQTAAGAQPSAYDPPGVTGVFKLLRDEQLWHTLAPAIEAARAFSEARAQRGNDPGDGAARG